MENIEFKIGDRLGLYGKTIEEKFIDGKTKIEFIRLTQNDGDDLDELYDRRLWLFSRKENGNQAYSVGFFVDEDGFLTPLKHPAFCFFPTKEATGLNFIIHAPFLLTDSREGIKAGEEYNRKTIMQLADLAADSLLYLRDIGKARGINLIGANILDIIPFNQNDPAFGYINSLKSISFKPFYSRIKETFMTEAIIPTQNDKHLTHLNAFWGAENNSQLASVFSNQQLAILTENDSAGWAFPELSTPTSGRSEKFIYIREIVGETISEFALLNNLTKAFIETQEIDWLHSFYKYILGAKPRVNRVKKIPIFLDTEGSAVAAYDNNNQSVLFLPTDGESPYITIHPALLENEDSLELIQLMEIKKPSLRDEIYNKILPLYSDDSPKDYSIHFLKFFKYYQSCLKSELDSYIKLLKEYKFISCKRLNNDEEYFEKPESAFFPSKELTRWYEFPAFGEESNALFLRLDLYLDLVGQDNQVDLEKFFEDLGVMKRPEITKKFLTEKEAYAIRPQEQWAKATRGREDEREWSELSLDRLLAVLIRITSEKDTELSLVLWSQLLCLIRNGKMKQTFFKYSDNLVFGKYEYFRHSTQIESFESHDAMFLRSIPWLQNVDGDFLPAKDLYIESLNSQYELDSNEAQELLNILGIYEQKENALIEEGNLNAYGARLGLTEEEQKLALDEFAKRKKVDEQPFIDFEAQEPGLPNGSLQEDLPVSPKSINRVAKELSQRAVSKPPTIPEEKPAPEEDIAIDEDDFTKPTINLSKRIERVKQKAEWELKDIARLEDLTSKAQNSRKYSFGWFKALLELESLNNGENNAGSREISISFGKVEREAGTERTLILRQPSRYIPQYMEDLADIPLELHFPNQQIVKIAIEVVNVKSYTLRVKLRTNAEIDGLDLNQVVEAQINAKNPVFLIQELQNAFIKLGIDNNWSDYFDLKTNLCKNIDFVFGPPGTGKTTHVAKDIILPLMHKPQDLKVLVLTPTNKAADIMALKIMEAMGDDESYKDWLIRFGTTNEGVIEKSGVYRDKTFDVRNFNRNVTITTIARFPYDYFLPLNSVRLPLNGLHWDYIIIDEASMIPIANIIYPLYKKSPTKFIIAGDPFQIEPITSVDLWKDENIYTLVRLNSFTEPRTVPHNYNVELLTTQYRSIPEIGDVFSQFAYGGVLKHYRTSSSQRTIILNNSHQLEPLNIIKFPVSKYESIYKPKRLQSKSPYHVYSAIFAFEYVSKLATEIADFNSFDNYRIGLIAPYAAQASLINKMMASANLPKNIDVQVDTIHGFQGDECDIIVALFNPPIKISNSKEMFLNKLNIINVSISRARDYLVILMPDDETENVDDLILIKKVEELFKQQKHWQEESSPGIEERFFGSKTFLEDNSFSTSHQLVNVYGKPEMRYEIRSEDNAVDIQLHK